MADLTLRERLQPSLLDRLTDKEPENSREARDRRVISENNLRESVMRDLSWLLNTAHMSASEDLDSYPAVKLSTLNYGVPDLAGTVSSSVNPRALEQGVRDAILRFEPRIMADSLKVKLQQDGSATTHGALSFRIEADLWAQPMPLNLFLRTDVDLETGSFKIVETSR